MIPFRVGVSFDETEALGTNNMANVNEEFEDPGGIVGFQLMYYQVPC